MTTPQAPDLMVRPPVGAASAEEERNLIVRFLRHAAEVSRQNGFYDRAVSLEWETSRIENGDHLRQQNPIVPGPYSGT